MKLFFDSGPPREELFPRNGIPDQIAAAAI